jgi:hypothetical protein
MGLFDSLRAALSSDNTGSSDDWDGDYLDIDGPFDENFPEPDNKSTLGDEEWRWDRVDEHPFDHYTEATDRVAELKREGRHDDVEELLRWCIDFVEAEAAFQQRQEYGYEVIATAYYRDLAIVYRKDDRHRDEVEVLKQYVDACRELGNDPQEKMISRLESARELAAGDQ